MRVVIRNEKGKTAEIPLDPREVKQTRRLVTWFLKRIREQSKQMHRVSYYLTALIVMNEMTSGLLRELDPETTQAIMEAYRKVFEEQDRRRGSKQEK